MTQTATPAPPKTLPVAAVLAGFLAVLTVVRLVGLRYSAADLFVDEAQYWSWSRELAFGYFSKPPLLAWLIAAAEAVCGDGEACIRAPAPILYFLTSLVVYALGRALYDARTGLWAALLTALGPGVNLLGPDCLDRRPGADRLGARALRLYAAQGVARLALGRAAGRGARPRHAGEIRRGLFPGRDGARGDRRSRGTRPPQAAGAVARPGGRRPGAGAEPHLERTQRLCDAAQYRRRGVERAATGQPRASRSRSWAHSSACSDRWCLGQGAPPWSAGGN